MQKKYLKNDKLKGNLNLNPKAYKKAELKLPRSGFVHGEDIV
jgi:hypothetical protein